MQRAFFCFSLLLLFACEEETPGCDTPAMLLDYAGLDGCGFVLVLEDGEVLEMGTFDQEPDFAFEDSLKINISYEPMDNMASVCMVGPIVRITCIEKAE